MKFNNKIIIIVIVSFLTSFVAGCAKNPEIINTIGYISNIDKIKGTLDFDEIEWIKPEDKNKIEELGLNVQDDFPSGFYINNRDKTKENYKISKNATFEFIDWKDEFKSKSVSLDEFVSQYNEFYKTFHEPFGEECTTPY